MNYKRIKNVLTDEIDNGLSDDVIFRRTVELFNGNLEETEKFLTSDYGGFTKGQINVLKYDYLRRKIRYEKSKAFNQVQAF